MKLNFHTSLGLPELPSDSSGKRYVVFSCWANTHTAGTYKGVRDAMPGLLHVVPHYKVFNYENPTVSEVEKMFQNSDRFVIFPFSVLNGGIPRIKWAIPGDIGVVLESLVPITWPYNVTEIILDKFEDFNFQNTLKQLYTDSPVSVVVKSHTKLLSGFCDFIKEVEKLFTYSNVLYGNINRLSSKELLKYGNAEFRMSFFKPSQCLPFFGKNHGAAVHVSITQLDYSNAVGKFSPLIELFGLFTDNIDAFMNVDSSDSICSSIISFNEIQNSIKEHSDIFNCVNKTITAIK